MLSNFPGRRFEQSESTKLLTQKAVAPPGRRKPENKIPAEMAKLLPREGGHGMNVTSPTRPKKRGNTSLSKLPFRFELVWYHDAQHAQSSPV